MTDPRSFIFLALMPLLTCVAAAQGDNSSPTPEQLEFFEKQVRPLLAEHCYGCHSVNAKRVEATLLLDSRKAHLGGGDSGPAIVPGDADDSLLIEAVRYESYEMPPKGKLPDRDIATLVRWVNMGAPWPDEAAPTADSTQEKFDLEKRKSEFWVWEAVENTDAPQVKNEAWPLNDIDRHILSRLEEANLKPSFDADHTALLRRLYFDLIGLPPAPEEVTAFLADCEQSASAAGSLDSSKPDASANESPHLKATEKVVDRLLASPHFGERWGRHWLDLVRYAESRGHEFDNDTPNAFQYRDYVIRALNADVPYDQFVREHIAGDLLTQPRMHPAEKFNESVLGTGFWFLGEWVHSPVDIRKDESDRFDNMLDVMSKTFLGVTVACARCHDHKFDAISTADYYSLSGFLQSSDYRQVRFESMEQNRQIAAQIAQVDKNYQQQIRGLLDMQGVRPPEQTDHLTDEAIIVDYGNIPQSDYLQDGYIFGSSPRRAGRAYLATGPKPRVTIATFGAAVNDPIWSGLESITKGTVQNQSAVARLPKSGRTLRSPTFELKDGNVSCLVDGAGHIVACVDSHRLVAGPLHRQTIRPIKADERWVKMNLKRYVGHRLHLEFVPAADAQLSVRLVTQGLNADELADLDRRLAETYKPFQEYAHTVETIFNEDDDSETEKRVLAEVGSETPDGRAENPDIASQCQKLASNWQQEREQLKKQIVRKSHVAPAMMDGTGEDDRVLIRGNSSKPGKVEPRHFLTAISGDSPMPIQSGSGRLELAECINDPNNPLTSRVIANRIWHHLMGRGIVPTVDDFGFLGQRPTHPELLDHLAMRFLAGERSIKRLIKYIVLSRTYQLSSLADPHAMEADPNNLLWHYRPPQRLQGEVIRDTLLALSDRLDRTEFGPPIPIHLTPFMDGRGRPKNSGPVDGNGRRSVYIAVRRNFLSPFMLTFDTPVPFSSMGRRNVSNVPAQALILLNDPLVVELSNNWGERALKAVTGTSHEAITKRIEWMYLSGFGREATDDENRTALAFLIAQAAKRGVSTDDTDLWSDFAHVLVNTKEFIFLR